MKILLVRHAQSQNNIVQAQVHTQLANKQINQKQAQDKWLANRMDDPGLSDDGLLQIQALEMYAAKVQRKNPDSKISIYTSPMTRACQTAQAVSKGVPGAPVTLNGDLCEVGGIYKAVRVGDNFEKQRGNAPSAGQLTSQFQGFRPGTLNPNGPWDGGRGFEQSGAAVARAERVAEWLKHRMPQEVGDNGVVIVVSHADFIALLIAKLMGVSMSGKGIDMNPDMDMSSHGISEGTLDDEIEQHCSSVYTRFRVSLACTTMIQVSGNDCKVLWMNKKKHLQGKNCSVM
uniref:Phosphoglycerate mutase n=2 Tax=Hemiselmis andersenii TaxID=464988 RepID=A0A6U4NFT3_HEMAN|mmetsp:Transcript_4774/g.11043  ORF Transcript_4774/g.11043 Transcript_4774/m.11043 type:complete len:287 (-) Transcript_4774:65-925(-)